MEVPVTRRRDAIEQQAADYLAALAGEPDEALRAEVAAWIEADPHHAVAFARAEAVWDMTARLHRADESVPGADSEAEALSGAGGAARQAESARYRDDLSRPVVSATDPARRRFLALGAAALSCTAVGALSLHYWMRPDRIATRIGEVRDIRLPDGSHMHLNTATEVELSFARGRRLIRLISGEAFFRVSGAGAVPFFVDAAGAVIRALDSAFNVRLRSDLLELVVAEGAVAVRAAAEAARTVTAGEAAFVRSQAVTITPVDRAELEQKTAWRDHMVELNGETLVQAVQEFNRYRTAPLIIGDSRIGGYRVGGRFDTGQAEQFVAAMEENFPIRGVRGSDGSILLLYRDDARDETPDAAAGAKATGPETGAATDTGRTPQPPGLAGRKGDAGAG